MRNVAIIGIGQTPVIDHSDLPLRRLAHAAVHAALSDAGIGRAGALFVANMFAGTLAGQEHLGALVADFAGLRGVEALRVEAGAASGAAALRAGFLAVASGAVEVAVVLGIEQMAGRAGPGLAAAQGYSLDSDYEAEQGVTPAALAALLMRRYLHETGAARADLAAFAVNARANAAHNPLALLQSPVTVDDVLAGPMVADPITRLDQAPPGDGAAALVLAPHDQLGDAAARAVRIAGSAVGTDAPAVHDRRDPLFLEAAYAAAVKAYEMAGVGPGEIDAFETHDAYTLLAALTLEACGFARRGEAVQLARSGAIGLMGHTPTSTCGGLLGRGDAGGATGVYQAVELVHQLRGDAGANQVPNARWGMSMALGGLGATAIAHILRAPEG